MQWPQLRALLDNGDVAGVVSAARDLTEQQRRELSQPVIEYSKALRRTEADPNNWSGAGWEVVHRRRSAMTVASAACLTTAARLAPQVTWMSLFRNDGDPADPVAAVIAVLRARDVPWLPDLAERLAERLPRTESWQSRDVMRLVCDLVEMTGMDPPLTDGYVQAWLAQSWFRPDAELADAIRRDRRLIALVARMFEVEGLDIPVTPLAELAAEGVLDRAMLIDGCLSRLQRGGQAFSLKSAVDLLDALAPALDEVAERAPDYVALLPGGHRMAAELAQRELRRLDDHGRLDPPMLAEISDIVLNRREHKLVIAQLEWLDAVARRDPGRSGDVLRAVTAAFGQASADLQRRALTVARRHARHADKPARSQAAQAAAALRPALRARALATFGAPAGASAGAGADEAPHGNQPAGSPPAPMPAVPSASPLPPPMPALPAPSQLPPPIGSPAELNDELMAMRTAPERSADPGWLERMLAALVAFSCQDRAGLRDAGLPFPSPVPGEGLLPASEAFRVGSQPAGRPPAPHRAMMLRLREISAGITYAPRRLLMATPTGADGLLDPDVLLSRLERAAAEGWEPWELDLEQALLRLPRECCLAPGAGSRSGEPARWAAPRWAGPGRAGRGRRTARISPLHRGVSPAANGPDRVLTPATQPASERPGPCCRRPARGANVCMSETMTTRSWPW